MKKLNYTVLFLSRVLYATFSLLRKVFQYLLKLYKQRKLKQQQEAIIREWLATFKQDDELLRKKERAERIKFFLDENRNIEMLQKLWNQKKKTEREIFKKTPINEFLSQRMSVESNVR